MCKAEMKPKGWWLQTTVGHMVVICNLTAGPRQAWEEVVVSIWLQDARRHYFYLGLVTCHSCWVSRAWYRDPGFDYGGWTKLGPDFSAPLTGCESEEHFSWLSLMLRRCARILPCACWRHEQSDTSGRAPPAPVLTECVLARPKEVMAWSPSASV